MWAKNSIFITLLVLSLFLVVILAPFGPFDITGYVTRTGQLQIGNSVPSVIGIYLNEKLASDIAADVIINPITNTTSNISVKVTISDTNGNCDNFDSDNVTVYLCNASVTVCNSTFAAHTVTLSYNTTDGQWGSGNRYCNMSGTDELFQFYEINGSWLVNATVTDGVDTSDPFAKNWTYNELSAFTYAEGGNIAMGVVNLEQWNNGTGQEEMKNTGNIIIDLEWNATNFTGQTHSEQINITGSNYIIDDDSDGSTDVGSMDQVFMNESYENNVTFVPDSGLLRCSAVACTNENATFDVYWHIYLPGGLAQDTYDNTIEVRSNYH